MKEWKCFGELRGKQKRENRLRRGRIKVVSEKKVSCFQYMLHFFKRNLNDMHIFTTISKIKIMNNKHLFLQHILYGCYWTWVRPSCWLASDLNLGLNVFQGHTLQVQGHGNEGPLRVWQPLFPRNTTRSWPFSFRKMIGFMIYFCKITVVI